MAKVFTPLAILIGLAAGQVGKSIFTFVWSKIDDEDAPSPKHRQIDGAKLVIALLVQGAIFQLVRGLADHGARHGWMRLVGEWPGEERPEPE